MDWSDAQIECAALKAVERQAERTAKAIKQVIALMREMRSEAVQCPSPVKPHKPSTKKPTRNKKK